MNIIKSFMSTARLPTKVLDGRKISKEIQYELKHKILKHKIQPGLGIILVGERPDSKVYVNMKKKACKRVGIKNFDIHLPETSTQDEIIKEIQNMNDNPEIHGILVQLPLPRNICERDVLNNVLHSKDVDGFHSINMGNLALGDLMNTSIPCTPSGCLELLERYDINVERKDVVIVGRSNIVGLPLSLLLMHKNATVTICHSRTKDLKSHTQKADILICAFGSPRYITSDYIKEGCIILDVGINKIVDPTRKKGYRLVGDVDYNEVYDKVEAITPVPGGIGPMTIAMLLSHTVDLCIKSKCSLEKNPL